MSNNKIRRLTASQTLLLLLAVICFSTGCFGDNSVSQGPNPESSGGSAPTEGFVDVTKESGIDFRMGFLPNEQGEKFKINLYDHGCGVAVGDYDGDGDDDVYLLNQLGANGLYRNRGDGTFENVTEAMGVGLEDRISVGATFSDYDNDGDQDLFVTSTRGGNVLYRNEGDGKLVDGTKEAGLEHQGHSQSAAFFDYDNDGLLDLYLVQTSKWTTDDVDEKIARYYLGKGDGGDFNAVIRADVEPNILYHNNGDGTFTDVTEQAGMEGRGWAGDIAVLDYDEDGWQDVLVTSMFGRAQLYRNEGTGKFSDVTMATLGRTPFGGIGAKVFDYNNDGKLDIYIVDMHSDMWMGIDGSHSTLAAARESEKVRFSYFFGPNVENSEAYQQKEAALHDVLEFSRDEVLFGNAFYKNLGDGKFEEISGLCNLETFWPWGIIAGDFDSDGFVDVMLPSGMGYPFYYWRNYLLMNNGHESFVERGSAFGIEPPKEGKFLSTKIADQDCARSSRCGVAADFDGDGRLDMLVNNFNHEPYYYRNNFPKKNFVAFRLTGTRSNRDAIGAELRLTSGDTTMVRQVECAGGYLSHSSKTAHFGLGDLTAIDKVEIRWPSGTIQTLEDVEMNKLHEIQEPEEEPDAT